MTIDMKMEPLLDTFYADNKRDHPIPYAGAKSNGKWHENGETLGYICPPCPVFYPTFAEFENPLQFIHRIRHIGQRSGIVKIVPPEGWRPPFAVNEEKFKFRSRLQPLNCIEGHSREEGNFVEILRMFLYKNGTPMKELPKIGDKVINLHALYKQVMIFGGFAEMTDDTQWEQVLDKLNIEICTAEMFETMKTEAITKLKDIYYQSLLSYELFVRKESPSISANFSNTDDTAAAVQDNKDTTTTASNSSSRMATISSRGQKQCKRGMKRSRHSSPGSVTTTATSSTSNTSMDVNSLEPVALTPDPNRNIRLEPPVVRVGQKFYRSFHNAGCFVGEVKKILQSKKPTVTIEYEGGKRETIPLGTMQLILANGYDRYAADIALNNQICQFCLRGDMEDQMLLCDSCNGGYHIFCLDHPLTTIPVGDWYCSSCVQDSMQQPETNPKFGFEMGQEYSLAQFKHKADTWMEQYFQTHYSGISGTSLSSIKSLNTMTSSCTSSNNNNPAPVLIKSDPTNPSTTIVNLKALNDLVLEKEYWHILSSPIHSMKVDVEYGSDVDTGVNGSGFPLKDKMRKLPNRLLERLNVVRNYESSLKFHSVGSPPTSSNFNSNNTTLEVEEMEASMKLKKLLAQDGHLNSKDESEFIQKCHMYANSGWNLNNLPKLNQSLLQYLDEDIKGVMVPWMYVGMCFSTFCWHVEDHNFYSISYLHRGAPKSWYGVPGFAAAKFEETMRKMTPDLFGSQPDLHLQLVTMFSPKTLLDHNVPVYRATHNPNEFMVTFPSAYHGGFNNGFNLAEAVNFATTDWIPWGVKAIQNYKIFNKIPVFAHEALLCSLTGAVLDNQFSDLTAVANYLIPALKQSRQDCLDFQLAIEDFGIQKVEDMNVYMESQGRAVNASTRESSRMRDGKMSTTTCSTSSTTSKQSSTLHHHQSDDIYSKPKLDIKDLLPKPKKSLKPRMNASKMSSTSAISNYFGGKMSGANGGGGGGKMMTSSSSSTTTSRMSGTVQWAGRSGKNTGLQCIKCKQYCFLQAVVCLRCRSVACFDHFRGLCRCDHTLYSCFLYRFPMDYFENCIESIMKNIAQLEQWNVKYWDCFHSSSTSGNNYNDNSSNTTANLTAGSAGATAKNGTNSTTPAQMDQYFTRKRAKYDELCALYRDSRVTIGIEHSKFKVLENALHSIKLWDLQVKDLKSKIHENEQILHQLLTYANPSVQRSITTITLEQLQQVLKDTESLIGLTDQYNWLCEYITTQNSIVSEIQTVMVQISTLKQKDMAPINAGVEYKNPIYWQNEIKYTANLLHVLEDSMYKVSQCGTGIYNVQILKQEYAFLSTLNSMNSVLLAMSENVNKKLLKTTFHGMNMEKLEFTPTIQSIQSLLQQSGVQYQSLKVLQLEAVVARCTQQQERIHDVLRGYTNSANTGSSILTYEVLLQLCMDLYNEPAYCAECVDILSQLKRSHQKQAYIMKFLQEPVVAYNDIVEIYSNLETWLIPIVNCTIRKEVEKRLEVVIEWDRQVWSRLASVLNSNTGNTMMKGDNLGMELNHLNHAVQNGLNTFYSQLMRCKQGVSMEEIEFVNKRQYFLCTCRQIVMESMKLVQCTCCFEKFHPVCVGVPIEAIARRVPYVCQSCCERMRKHYSYQITPPVKPLFCMCRESIDDTPMICCDFCDEWYHGTCINMSPLAMSTLEAFCCQACSIQQGFLAISKLQLRKSQPTNTNTNSCIKLTFTELNQLLQSSLKLSVTIPHSTLLDHVVSFLAQFQREVDHFERVFIKDVKMAHCIAMKKYTTLQSELNRLQYQLHWIESVITLDIRYMESIAGMVWCLQALRLIYGNTHTSSTANTAANNTSSRTGSNMADINSINTSTKTTSSTSGVFIPQYSKLVILVNHSVDCSAFLQKYYPNFYQELVMLVTRAGKWLDQLMRVECQEIQASKALLETLRTEYNALSKQVQLPDAQVHALILLLKVKKHKLK